MGGPKAKERRASKTAAQRRKQPESVAKILERSAKGTDELDDKLKKIFVLAEANASLRLR